MACQFDVVLPIERPAGADETAIDTLDLIDALEAQLTVYRDQSEVSDINRRAAFERVPVEERLFQLLQQALELHDQTQGAFDITAAPLIKCWGFYRRAGRIPTAEELAAARDCVGSHWIRLEPQSREIWFERQGVEINLGAIGKGYALDRGAEHLAAWGVSDFIFHGGNSSVLARGSSSHAEGDRPGWRVGLKHPMRTERRLAEVWLRTQALGTSGAGAQFFFHQGKRYGHILDSRTGMPAEGVLSSTVIAPTAAQADALATAFYVLGVEGMRDYCESHPEIAAILVTPAPRSGGIELHVANLAEDAWRRLD